MLAKIHQSSQQNGHRCGAGCLHGAHMLTRRRALQIGSAGAALGVAGCITTNRATGRTTLTGFNSLEDDAALGRQEHPKLVAEFGGEYENPRLQSYVEKLGQVLAGYAEYQEFQYKFTIVNSWIVNAFALPGGYVYVSRGLLALASNEAELAGVVGHEIGHVNARHTAQRIAQSQLAQGLLLGAVLVTGQQAIGNIGSGIASSVLKSFSREQEMEADSLGLRYMSRAGYDPEAMVGFLDTLRDHSQVEAEKQGLPKETVDEANINATHPRTIERVRAAESQSAALKAPDQLLNRDRYLDTIDGMIYGDDPKQGLVRGTEFLHPDLRLYFKMPDGFVIRNGATNVVAQKPNVKAIIVFDQAERKTGDVYSYLTQEWAKGTTLSDLGRIDINGLAAATGATRIEGMDYRAVVIQGDGNTVYRFRFISDPSITSQFDVPFRETTYSFRRMSQAEASRIKPFRLIVVPIAPGDTVASLSKGFPEGNFSQAAFRVMNDLKPSQPLPSSGEVKVVVGGTGV
ncbi:M48 family metalloprotease [Rhodospirillaceae bacterium KN72]|uniref:M48 family metalloprotease n=1 Tax=Pacificispira spongiicola TaxID=2729598 RepID=A0A7Y0HG14_9PROT|nr:M48 family metalloprotease [Pacificispira spongiicola]NMM46445.1 M48 family metalloprotease [Pacificispira spongiicola]